MPEEIAPLIAVVEDEARLRQTIARALEREGYRTCQWADGWQAWETLKGNHDVRLVILDILMPRMDGRELCRRIRGATDRLPVIFLTSRDDEFDRVLGLELGADDYLCKPFSLRELVARVRALLRRAGLAAEPAPASGLPEEQPVACGELAMDPARFSAAWKGSSLRLTVTEFRILSSLARAPGMVRSRSVLLAAAFPQEAAMGDRTVDTHVKRIRRKLEEVDPGFDRIETVHGLGYRWRDES
jgi:two-component system response regulator ChvI